MLLSASILAASAAGLTAKTVPGISGQYLEVRSCDVFTGPCFANAEMGLTGKEAILVWSVRDGQWEGTPLTGLSVIAVVRADGTMGNLQYEPRRGKAVLILDSKANAKQRAALTHLAQSLAGNLVAEVAAVRTSPVTVALGTCDKAGCASVSAPGLVDINTRCLNGKDHVCGNEEIFYPPLTSIHGALPAFTEVAAFTGEGLGLTWHGRGQRNAFLGSFSR